MCLAKAMKRSKSRSFSVSALSPQLTRSTSDCWQVGMMRRCSVSWLGKRAFISGWWLRGHSVV